MLRPIRAKMFASKSKDHQQTDRAMVDEEKLLSSDADLRAERQALPSSSSPAPRHLTKPKPEPEPDGDGVEEKVENDEPVPFRYIPVVMQGNKQVPTTDSAALVDEIGGLPSLLGMTSSFYDKAFQDATLDRFIRSHADPHGERFSKWIHAKLTGSDVWNEDRRARVHEPVHDRTSAHVAAWHSPKRPASERGRHFKLDECRVWMRLHFWALRDAIGETTSPSFVDFYVRFIGHFIRVYEGAAPAFARDSYRWSADRKNISEYIKNGRKMRDVLGLSLSEALGQIPEEEATDNVWPYDA
ncbi:hypothetical protein THAOC_13456 [Thalassiosira oceanica]|uniref:Uncharacterized protein n=1 Tax=Thalassiosira oceanica TaxID=159749 RepID=K0SL34_THAOC|nr:hypothetical protein THAOC_13456 [Thalassiosira oceanica]|eukprot:EJK65659.1 hypothetical protein THAOC_13456 [Thalassiosira oceanica]